MAEDIITASIVFDMKGLRRAAQGFGQGPARAASGMAGQDKSISSMTKGIGKMAVGFAGALVVFQGIKSLIGKLVASSPQLQASIDILKKSFEFMLRPIGDAIGGALRPFALAWLRFGLKWFKDVGPKMEKWFTDLIDNTSELAKRPTGVESVDQLIEGLGQAPEAMREVQESIAETTASSLSFSEKLKSLIPDGLKEVVIALGAVFGSLFDALKGIFGFLFEILKPVIAILGIALIGALKLVTFALLGLSVILDIIAIAFNFAKIGVEALFLIISEWAAFLFGKGVEAVKTIAGALREFFTKTIPEAWENLKKSVADKMDAIMTVVSDIWEGIKTTVSTIIESIGSIITTAWETIKKTISGIVDGIIALINTIPFVNIGRNGDTSPVVQDFILRGNNLTRFSPQDTIMGFKGSAPTQGGGGMTVQVTINALDPSSIDDNVIRKITEAIDNAQRRGILSRTMQAAGS